MVRRSYRSDEIINRLRETRILILIDEYTKESLGERIYRIIQW